MCRQQSEEDVENGRDEQFIGMKLLNKLKTLPRASRRQLQVVASEKGTEEKKSQNKSNCETLSHTVMFTVTRTNSEKK